MRFALGSGCQKAADFWIPDFRRFGERSLSESGFAGLKDFQDSHGEHVCDWRAFVGSDWGIFGYGEQRNPGES